MEIQISFTNQILGIHVKFPGAQNFRSKGISFIWELETGIPSRRRGSNLLNFGPFPRCQSHLPGLELGGGFLRSTTNRTTVPVRNLPPKILTESSSQKIGENGIS